MCDSKVVRVEIDLYLVSPLIQLDNNSAGIHVLAGQETEIIQLG